MIPANDVFWTTIIVLACTTVIMNIIDNAHDQKKEFGIAAAYGAAVALGFLVVAFGGIAIMFLT